MYYTTASRPCRTLWEKSIPGHCIPTPPMWYVNALLIIAKNLAIFVLPRKTIYALSLPRGQKISLGLVFALRFLYVTQSALLCPSSGLGELETLC